MLCFGALYVASFGMVRHRRVHRLGGRLSVLGAVILMGEIVLSSVVCWAVGQPGTATFVFVAVSGVVWLPVWLALSLTAGLALLHEILVRTVPGWENQPALTFSCSPRPWRCSESAR
ncbi:MAG: hypothetical protein R2731_16270 [Nocardioides sp.]